jgi:hypothetical protein
LTVNPSRYQPGDILESGEYCRIVFAVEARGRIPARDDFFKASSVGPEDKKKVHAALRNFSVTGPTSNTERYKRLGDIHYLKVHAFRIFCIERVCQGVRELVVCHIEPKKHDKALPDAITDKAWHRFEQHCERFP